MKRDMVFYNEDLISKFQDIIDWDFVSENPNNLSDEFIIENWDSFNKAILIKCKNKFSDNLLIWLFKSGHNYEYRYITSEIIYLHISSKIENQVSGLFLEFSDF